MDQSAPKVIRKKFHRHEHGVRFITFSCYRRFQLFAKPGAKNTFVESLYQARDKFGFSLFAWVVMPEHVHILMHPRSKATMDRILLSIKLSTSMKVLERWTKLRAPILDRIRTTSGRPRFWQPGGGFDRNVRDEFELRREIRYIHRNPVERGIVEHPEQWEWSSVRWWMGEREGVRPCDLPLLNERELAAWIRSYGYM